MTRQILDWSTRQAPFYDHLLNPEKILIAVQGHPTSPIVVPIEIAYAISY